MAPCADAAPGLPQRLPSTSPQITAQFAIADFDGDNRPDLATVQTGQINSLDTRYWIGFQLSSGSQQTLGITAPNGGLQLTSRDVNGDSFLDLIVTTAWTNRPVAVLLNDGHGNFTRFDPTVFPSALQSSEFEWASTSVEIKDAGAALPSRNFYGDCVERGRISSPHSVIGRLLPPAPQGTAFLAVASFFGRAPPTFVPLA